MAWDDIANKLNDGKKLYLDYMRRFERNYCVKYLNRLLRQAIAYFSI